MFIEYRGNRFELEKIDSWYARNGSEYRLRRLQADSEELWLPDKYQSSPVTEWYMHDSEKQIFDNIRILHIPAEIRKIHIRNDIFPRLREVSIDPANTEFTTDGKMIFYENGSILKYCPVCMGETIEIPANVRKIEEGAFSGTEYKTILFPKTDLSIEKDAFRNSKTDLSIEKDAFRNSRWLENQGDIVIIGSLMYRAEGKRVCLTIPEGVKRLHPALFSYSNIPEKIVSPFMLSQKDIFTLDKYGRTRSLTITSARADINIRVLRQLGSLEEISIPEEHKKYKTIDGVLYSGDGKTLLCYPCSKTDKNFVIPDGVRKIGESAFARQKYLEEVVLPDSVSIICARSFLECERLHKVHLSSAIREIPDSNAYLRGGVFEGCIRLKEVTLPEKLNYLGSFAFYKSGLSSIILNAQLEQIGEYALMAKRLNQIKLPASVKRIGRGALFYAAQAEVWEGTAKGLVAAVNAVAPDTKDKSANLVWGRCEVTVRRRRSGKQELFIIPGSLRRNAAYHLDMAWNGEHIDYEEYDECLSEIEDPEEKLEFAELGLMRRKEGGDNPYEKYIRQVSFKMGCRLLNEGKEREFLTFLKQGYLSQSALPKLLKISNEKGMTVCSAYITEVQNRNARKKSSFRL